MLQTTFLADRLATLGRVRRWTPALLAGLAGRLGHADDALAHRIDPTRFAAELGGDPAEALDLFLHATKHNLVEMTWGLVCPLCGDTVKSFATLSLVASRFFCKLCARETQVSLDDWVKVTFTVHPELRDVRFRRPETLTIEDYTLNCRFATPGTMHNGGAYPAGFLAMVRHLGWLAPGAEQVVTLAALPGELRVYDLLEETSRIFPVAAAGERTGDLRFTERTLPAVAPAPLAAGQVTLTLANPSAFRRGILVANLPTGFDPSGLTFLPFLTGREVLASQTFRDLFRNESVASSSPLGVRELTFLFTDLKGSTELYGRVGDMRAFELVRRHFETLGQAILAHRGALVKTIGDAVMATFLRPDQALAAARTMVEQLDRVNREEGGRDLILKVGIHSGATIAVTLNERLDYFGQTVNIAARVQGLAAANEICVTAETYAQPGAAEAAGACTTSRSIEALRGVDGKREIVRLSPLPAAAQAG